MTAIVAINIGRDLAFLDDGTTIPILEYYDHSRDCMPVDKLHATQCVAGTDKTGYWAIRLWEFGSVTIH